MIIKKKITPEYFKLICSGKKKFELRLADFECKPGDTLLLKEWNPDTKEYTGRVIEKEVTFVVKTKDCKFWKSEEIEKYGYQVIGLK